jgi:choline transport protein
MAPRRSAADALLNFTNEGGWSSTGLSSMVGLLAPMAVLVGYDCSVHMSEEIKDASIILPRAIMGSVILNVTLVFTLIVTLCFTLGDPLEALESPTGYAFIQVLYNATQSLAGTTVLTFVVAFMLAICAVSEAAACSRQIWAFARDAGLPGHRWLSTVSPHWNIPLPGIIVSLTISALLSLINIGSSVALNAITSLGAVATLISYYITIGCLVHRRLYGAPLPPRRWSLGRFGLLVNVAALTLLTPLIFFLTWPLTTPVTAETMNWSSVMLAGVFIIATVYYFVQARKEYEGPVVHVRRHEE